jgi:hypothetical protein
VFRQLLRLVAALALVFPAASGAIPVAAQSAGFLVQYEGTLTLTDVPAPAGTTIHAVAATTWSDMTDCGQAKVDTQGHYALRVTNAQCVTADMNHVPVQHYFIVNGENVGSYEGAVWLNLPRTLGKVFSVKLIGTALPGADLSSVSNMVLARFIGTLLLDRVVAPRGTAVVVRTAPTGPNAVTCGNGQVVDDQGLYVVDVKNPQCITADMNHVPVQRYFIVNGENVGGYEGAIWLNLPHTLGKVFFQKLNGTGAPVPGDTFNAGPTPTPTAGQPQPQPESPLSPPANQQQGGQEPAPVRPGQEAGTPAEPPVGIVPDPGQQLADPGVTDGMLPLAEDAGGPAECTQTANSPATLATAKVAADPERDMLDLHIASEPAAACAIVPPIILIREDDLRMAVEDCFTRALRVRNDPRAVPLDDLLSILNSRDLMHSYPIVIGYNSYRLGLNGLAGITDPSVSTPNAGVGAPVGATVWLHNPLISAVGTVADNLIQTGAPYDFCAVLFHELTHATDMITGRLLAKNDICFVQGQPVQKREIKATAVENAYRNAVGLRPDNKYHDSDVPEDAIHPTAASWRRYQAGQICGLL